MRIEYLGSKRRVVRKTTENHEDVKRLQQEATVLRHLTGNDHTPKMLHCKEQYIDLEYIDGQSLKEWIGLDDNWRSSPVKISEAVHRIGAYIDAEMSLLNAGVMYRDMNLEHVIFSDDRAVMIDLEASSVKKPSENIWRSKNQRGTWETMAPEEFANDISLTSRTATYRAAVIIHLVLAGRLPFDRVATSRSRAHRQRKARPACASLELPRAVRRVLNAALQIEPSRRPATPLNLLEKLEAAYE